MKLRNSIWLIGCVMVLGLSFSFQKQPDFKPTKDFSWLGRFVIFDEAVNISSMDNMPSLKKDSFGVIINNGNYNPCSICQYAIKAFDEYQKSGDTTLKNGFLKQVKWLIDTSHYKIINGSMLGHPYKYAFHDLKSPWYSGLSEAEFISVLIRYYSLTKDKTVLPLIISTRNFIIAKEEDGGLLTKTPEGNLWIEEYMPSKQERHVITGYYVLLISLDEYCHTFPGDHEAKDVLRKGLESTKKSMQFYDNGNGGIAYNRGDKRTCSNWYVKMLTIATRELYRISGGDKFFLNQYKLWSTYTYNKKVGWPKGACKIDDYNYSSLISKDSAGWYKFPYEKLDFSSKETISLPEFCHFTVDFNTTKEDPSIKFEITDVNDYLVFYRKASTLVLLNKEKWTQDNMFAQNNFCIDSDGKNFYRFLFIFKRKNLKSKIGNVSLN